MAMPVNRAAPYAEPFVFKGLIKSAQGFNLHEGDTSTSEHPSTAINAIAARKVGKQEP
jgi:hypothetical protein